MKLFAASENKLKRVTTVAKNEMESTGLKWNEKRCAVIHVKRGQFEQGSGDMKMADLKPIKSLDRHNTYKLLGVSENTKQEDKQELVAAGKTCLQRLSIIWSSPLSDHAKVVASNGYALPVLTYLMWTQTWRIANIQQLDREGTKIIVENGGNYPKGLTAILYMSRELVGRGPAAHLYPNINQLPHPPLELAFSILKDDTQSDYSELVSFVEQGFAILFQKQTSKDLL